jgi:hypothetical protein
MQMDELTQQNAALVEEATAASQAMAEQVRSLNGMLARFRVGISEIIAPAPAAPAPKPARKGAERGTRVDRRSANRPWTGRSNPAKPAMQKPESTRAAAPPASSARGNGTLGAGDAGDSEWQEF